jgi:23S rRNA (adenine2503-C2)-methyltransferase
VQEADTDKLQPPCLHGLTLTELTAACAALGEPEYRARQIWRWLYAQRVNDWATMKNVPPALCARLAERYTLQPCQRLAAEGEESGTRKILVGLRDAECVEEVLIPTAGHDTVCVSSQVGCRFGCTFCASGAGGFRRSLEAGEMVGEILLAAQELGGRPANVVFMGMGEPFDNYDAVLKSIRIVNDALGMAIGARHITISTCGIIPGIQRLATEGLQIELSISLHAPDDELRTRLMPVNRKFPLKPLLEACGQYASATKRLITFEYTLIKGLNDSRRHAATLVALLRIIPCRVNLIPLSPVAGFEGEPAPQQAADMFVNMLGRAGINATLRMSKGSGIQAACGQLRLRSQPASRNHHEAGGAGGTRQTSAVRSPKAAGTGRKTNEA